MAPLVALYAGDPKLPEVVEEMVRVTQDSDLSVACSVGGKLAEVVEEMVRVTQDSDMSVACSVGGTPFDQFIKFRT